MWDEITYKFPNFNGCTVDVREWISNFINIIHRMIYLYQGEGHAVWAGITFFTLRWRHNGYDSVSNHQPHDWLLNRLFRRRSKKTSKLRVFGLCAGNSPQMASNAENVSIWWRHHDFWRRHNSIYLHVIHVVLMKNMMCCGQYQTGKQWYLIISGMST